ncbi:Hsp20/alpha crystallin family protein [Bacillus suaedaesalsae]|uniref:Hsp20/alpha crystallin family protein n=1 Tax=Bacillus suaedaesalsae TaxID=2810349 RepID=A0ABS2DCP2_9BACI|nr:Hsp20/alpha crystallin family protein [Bacillus suaedaesalsae]MBM6616231.1 Hsp20/alpha crystallin family protein [Bacillus suaedaesalsae]
MNNPYLKDFSKMKDQFKGFFGDEFWGNFDHLLQNQYTQHNLYQSENELLCVINIPGITNIESLDVFVHQNKIEVEGKINLTYKGFKLLHEGIKNGPFKREIDLPFNVRSDKVFAHYEHGLLIIHLHRQIPDDHKKSKVSVKIHE